VKSLVLGVFALLANVGLFFLVSRAQARVATRPNRETWTVREVFQPAPPPRTMAPAEDAPKAVPDQAQAPQNLTPATSFEAPANEAFTPRTSTPSFDIGPTGVGGGPPVPLPFGLPGGPVRGTSQSQSAPAPLSLEQVDRAPQAALTPLPPYPPWARARRLTGMVTLKFVVDAEGAVRDVAVDSVDGDDRFGPVAVEAVAGWKFQPAVYEGKKVAVRVSQRVRFRLVE
jgi:protein TonB